MAQEQDQLAGARSALPPRAVEVPRTIDGALRSCRDALEHGVGDGSHLDGLHEPLRLLSVCAHRDNLPPERVLIELKQLLQEASALETTSPADRDEIRARIIRMAIDAYFAGDSSP